MSIYRYEHPMLLEDCTGYTTMQLSESVGGALRFRGKFQEANAVNKNKRMYPFDVLDGNVDKLEETVAARGLFGECDHPADSIVHLLNASHLVTKLWWEGNTLMGEGEILPTPSGMILKKLIESNCRIGISSRGVGNGQTNNEGVLVIGESYRLITFDAVADPSTYAAFQAKVTGKREHLEPAHDLRSENKRAINHKALVSYFGCALDQQLRAIRESRR